MPLETAFNLTQSRLRVQCANSPWLVPPPSVLTADVLDDRDSWQYGHFQLPTMASAYTSAIVLIAFLLAGSLFTVRSVNANSIIDDDEFIGGAPGDVEPDAREESPEIWTVPSQEARTPRTPEDRSFTSKEPVETIEFPLEHSLLGTGSAFVKAATVSARVKTSKSGARVRRCHVSLRQPW